MNTSMRYEDLRRAGGARPPHIRWYRAYRTYGRPGDVVESLASYIRHRRISDTVCAVRVERRARGEFYFFLAFDTEYFGLLPQEVESHLEECPHLQFGIAGSYTLDEIKSMVSGEVQVKALGQCINYRRLTREHAEDPFRQPEDGAETPSDRGEQLLWYLSSMGEGSWHSFGSAASALGFAGKGDATRLARGLRLLGHLETSDDGERWSVTAAKVVATPMPDGGVLRFRTGVRRPLAEGERTQQAWAPDRLEGCDDDAALQHPAATIAQALPDVRAFIRSLSQVGGMSHHISLKRFDGSGFVPTTFDQRPGMYEATSPSGRAMTLYFDGDAWRRGDWYGLRYLTLFEAGVLMPARYEAGSWQLAIPADQRPPELYERPLVLSSGLLPRRDESWFVYPNVTPEVAERVCGQLCMPLEVIAE